MPPGRRVSDEKRAMIAHLIQTGKYSVHQIAIQTHTADLTVLKIEIDIQQRAPRPGKSPFMGGKLGTYMRRGN